MPKFRVIVTPQVEEKLRALEPELGQSEKDAIKRSLRNFEDDPWLDIMKGRTTTTVGGRIWQVQFLQFMRSFITLTYHLIDNGKVVEVVDCHREKLPPPNLRL